MSVAACSEAEMNPKRYGASRSIAVLSGASRHFAKLQSQTLRASLALCPGNANETRSEALRSVAVLYGVSRRLTELQKRKTLRASPALCPGNADETRGINKKEGFGFENYPTRSYLTCTQARSQSYQLVDVVSS